MATTADTPTTDGRRQYPVGTMLRAREHHDAGWKTSQIPALLEREGLGRPSVNTIYLWVHPTQHERNVNAMRLRKARMAAQSASFRLSGQSAEYHLAFMARLRQEGIPCSSIAKVCRVVLGLDMSREQCRDLLRSRS